MHRFQVHSEIIEPGGMNGCVCEISYLSPVVDLHKNNLKMEFHIVFNFCLPSDYSEVKVKVNYNDDDDDE